jgi:hypothetical protein
VAADFVAAGAFMMPLETLNQILIGVSFPAN